MEENQITNSQNSPQEDTSYSLGKQLMVGVAVTLFIVLVGFFGYSYLQGHFTNQLNASKTVLSASTGQITPVATSGPAPQTAAQTTSIAPVSPDQSAPVQNTSKTCTKNGPAQKWEYLVPYVVKDGDTLQSIATTQLNDASRVNEIIQLNGQGPYVVGSTLYLPPSIITKSSGNIKEVYGLLVSRDSSYWHISFSSDPKGLGIVIPSFWFDGVANANSFNSNDCITVLFDDGNKVFSVTMQ